MNRKKILSIALTITFILSSLGVVLSLPSTASAFPSHDPQPSDYIFYDGFERSGTVGWPYWAANSVKDTFSNDHAYTGINSVKVATTGDGNSLSLFRFMSNDSTAGKNEGIMTEVALWDTHAWAIHEQVNLFLSNLGATSYIGLGVHCDTSRELYSYWYSNAGAPIVYEMTSIPRTVGWVVLGIQSVSHTQYRFYINHDWVGNCTIADATGMDYYGVYVHDIAGIGTTYYFDDFFVYPFFQDQIWHYSKIAIGNNLPYTTWAALEPTVLYDGGIYKLWYRAVKNPDGVTQWSDLGYATSTDGLNWTPYAAGPLVNLTYYGACPFVMKSGSTYYLYYEYNSYDWILSTSADGITWGAAVHTNLGKGGTSAWDHVGLGNICVWKEGAVFNALYEARSNSTIWSIGYANSTDGVHWTKYASNPVTPAGTVFGNPEIHKYGETYYMLAHGDYSRNQYPPCDIYLLKSTNLITWTNCTFSTQFTRLINYYGMREQAADPTYYEVGARHFLMFAGTKNSTNEQRLYISESKYSLEQIADGDVLQWGTHFMGGIGVTNNVTTSGKYWYSGINALKGTYTDNFSVNSTTDINITMTVFGNLSVEWTADSGTGSPAVNYTVYGLEPDKTFYICVDEGIYQTIKSTDNGTLSFSYSGSSGSHVFTVDFTMVHAFGVLWIILPIVLVLAIVMSILPAIIGGTAGSGRKN
jgi:hypothetical protein